MSSKRANCFGIGWNFLPLHQPTTLDPLCDPLPFSSTTTNTTTTTTTLTHLLFPLLSCVCVNVSCSSLTLCACACVCVCLRDGRFPKLTQSSGKAERRRLSSAPDSATDSVRASHRPTTTKCVCVCVCWMTSFHSKKK